MKKLTDFKSSRYLLIGCIVSYVVIAAAKLCVPTVISSMVSEGFLNKSQSGILSGTYYLVYGVGQLLFGSYFNTHSPFRGIKLAMIGTFLCCIGMALTKNFYGLLTIWSICALVNAGYFPALMRIVSFLLCDRDSLWANKYIFVAQQMGSVVSLLAGGLIMKYLEWNYLYYFSALIIIIALIPWFMGEVKTKISIKKDEVTHHYIPDRKDSEIEKRPISSYIGSGIFMVFLIAFFNAMLGGIRTWAPTIIMETYNVTSSFSVLLSIVVVVSNVVFLVILGKHLPRDKVKSMVIFNVLMLPLVVLTNFASVLNEYMYVLLLGLVTAVSAYVTNVTVVQIPYYFKRYNDVARISGIVNMFASFGVLAGNYSFGTLADSFGWQIIMILSVIFVCLIIGLSLIALPKFREFTKWR